MIAVKWSNQKLVENLYEKKMWAQANILIRSFNIWQRFCFKWWLWWFCFVKFSDFQHAKWNYSFFFDILTHLRRLSIISVDMPLNYLNTEYYAPLYEIEFWCLSWIIGDLSDSIIQLFFDQQIKYIEFFFWSHHLI